VIERFKNRDARAVYARAREQGRMLPEGLGYVVSWVETNFDRCFQVMECDDERLLHEWADRWSDPRGVRVRARRDDGGGSGDGYGAIGSKRGKLGISRTCVEVRARAGGRGRGRLVVDVHVYEDANEHGDRWRLAYPLSGTPRWWRSRHR